MLKSEVELDAISIYRDATIPNYLFKISDPIVTLHATTTIPYEVYKSSSTCSVSTQIQPGIQW